MNDNENDKFEIYSDDKQQKLKYQNIDLACKILLVSSMIPTKNFGEEELRAEEEIIRKHSSSSKGKFYGLL